MAGRTGSVAKGAPVAVGMEFEVVGGMDRSALLDLWPKVMGSVVPGGMSQGLLRRFLAFEIQVKAKGGLTKSELDQLARLASGAARPKSPRAAQGTRFLREWNGVTHVVERAEAGYLWNGGIHASLSAIAKAITGAHWSGPRFFGLVAAAAAARGAGKKSAAARPPAKRRVPK